MNTDERRRVLEVRYHRDPPFAAACDLIGPNGWTDEDGCSHNGPTLGTALKVASLFDAIGYHAAIERAEVLARFADDVALVADDQTERAIAAETERDRYLAVVEAARQVDWETVRLLVAPFSTQGPPLSAFLGAIATAALAEGTKNE